MEWGNHHFSHIEIQLTLNIYRDRMSRKPKTTIISRIDAGCVRYDRSYTAGMNLEKPWQDAKAFLFFGCSTWCCAHF